MALDAYGNYIPDQYAGQFGGQPMGMDPSMMQNQMPQGVTPGSIPLQNMNPQAMPQQQGQAQLPVQNMTPVAAPQRQSIAPDGIQPTQMGQSPVAATAQGLAQGLRNMQDKDGKLGNWQFDKTPAGKIAYGIGDVAGSAYDKIAGLFS